MTAPHKHAEILRAIADGKEAECKLAGSWNTYRYSEIDRESISPLTNPDLEWRIKPEKQVLRYRVAKFRFEEIRWLEIAYSSAEAVSKGNHKLFVEWIHDWQEVEVK